MNKPRNFYKGTFHHLYNRGANKQQIFFEETNYIYFLEKLKHYKDKYQIEILSCLTNIKEVLSYFESEKQMKEFLIDQKIKVNYEF